MGKADGGWDYTDQRAILISHVELFDREDATVLGIIVANTIKGDDVLLYLHGDITEFALRPKQQYIVASFFDKKKKTRWAVTPITINGNTILKLVNPQGFINKLRTADFFSITLPIAEEGTQTFYFSADGYPLDW